MFKKICWVAALAIVCCIVAELVTRHFFNAINDMVMLFALMCVIYGSRQLFKRNK